MSKITVLANGPFIVDGVGEIVDANGKPFDTGGRPKVALCRCGHSRTKPFCDSTHKSSGFVADDAAPRR